MTGAIHLSSKGFNVTLIEKSSYPKHKVCGEFISNEVLPYFGWLDADPSSLHPSRITRFMLSAVSGNIIESKLPLGGFGISRYRFDEFLYKKAKKNGCAVIEDTVTGIDFMDDEFNVSTAGNGVLPAKIVIGAHGKRSNIDQALSRNFIRSKSPWLAVKAHYKGEFPDDMVALHTFIGGYCGVSKVEDDVINICYLCDYDSFKRYKNINHYERQVIHQNRHLKKILMNSKMIFDQPVTIGQISFEKKAAVENHILMTGDSAGLIHPLCGNGMAMAIHSAKICAELVAGYFSGEIKSREMLENEYELSWNKAFSRRLRTGRILESLFRRENLFQLLVSVAEKWPVLLPFIIRQTHGKPLTINK